MLASGVQLSDSVICIYIYTHTHIHTHTHTHTLFPILSQHGILHDFNIVS